jgi:hypothetical protein
VDGQRKGGRGAQRPHAASRCPAVEAIPLRASWGHASGAVGGSPHRRARVLPVRRVLGPPLGEVFTMRTGRVPRTGRYPTSRLGGRLAAGLVTRQQRCRIAHDASVVANGAKKTSL